MWERRVPSRVFGKVEALDRSYWVHTRVVTLNGLGRVRVVASYDNPDLEGDPNRLQLITALFRS